MFSNRSVSVQPSAAPIEYGVTPDSFNVLPAARKSSQFSGGSTPASSKAATLYQTVDLLAPLKKRPYSFPSTVPRSSQESEKPSLILSSAKSIGFSAPRWAKSVMKPGWGSAAMSGGLPPSTAVESTVAGSLADL